MRTEKSTRLALVVGLSACLAFIVWALEFPLPHGPKVIAVDPSGPGGELRFRVLEAGWKPEMYFFFALRPRERTVNVSYGRVHAAEAPKDLFARPPLGGHFGRCYGSPHLPSPDQRFTLYCEAVFQHELIGNRETSNNFVIANAATGERVLSGSVPVSARICGLAWSPASDAVAVLTGEGRPSPFTFLIGHGTPSATFYVDVIGLNGSKTYRARLRANSPDSSAAILSWE